MKILRLVMPRSFTLTVKSYDHESASALESNGAEYSQVDLNPTFWRYLLNGDGSDLFERLVDPDLASASLAEAVVDLRMRLNVFSKSAGIAFDLFGPKLGQRSSSDSAFLRKQVTSFPCIPGLDDFLETLRERVIEQQPDIVAIDVVSEKSLFYAFRLILWAKSNGSKAHFCLANHSYENFSLTNRIEEVAETGGILLSFDSILIHKEHIPEALCQLAKSLLDCNIEPMDAVVRSGRSIIQYPMSELPGKRSRNVKIPAEYFEFQGVRPEWLVYETGMVRNRCYYAKCTFCVQILKHAADRFYEPATELERAIGEMRALLAAGVRHVSFDDEAMRPKDIERFCDALKEKKLDIKWTARIIAAVGMNDRILRTMKEAGCSEILLGLETVIGRVAGLMGKVSDRNSEDEIFTFLDRIEAAGLDVVLSMIHGFPGETVQDRESSLRFIGEVAERYRNVTFIHNRFALFLDTAVYLRNAEFGISGIEKSKKGDIQQSVEYIRPSIDMASFINRSLPWAKTLRETVCGDDYLEILLYLDYASTGVLYRARHGVFLRNALSENLSTQLVPAVSWRRFIFGRSRALDA